MTELIEQIAKQIYTDWNRSLGLTWEDLPNLRKNSYRQWVKEYVVTLIREEIEKSLLTDEEMRQLVLDNIKLFDDVGKAPTLLFVIAEAQLDKILALFKEK